MGSHQTIQFFTQFHVPTTFHNNSNSYYYHPRSNDVDKYSHSNNTRRSNKRCFSGGENPNNHRRSRFNEASYITDDYDDDDDVFGGFRNTAKQRRIWWSDNFNDDDYDDDDGEVFTSFEASIGLNLVSKVFRAFGWMIPAVVISWLMGTGPNAIIMALALPLAQSALSLAADTLWGRSYDTPRPKTKSKKRPFGGATARTRARKQTEKQTRASAGGYKSWVDANNVPNRNSNDFGGWDELDSQVRVDELPRMHIKKENEPRAQEGDKISGRTKGDTPLFVRLLIATFPFLGFWSKFL